MSDVVIRVENVSKLYRLGEVGTGSLAHDVNRWWHKVRGKEDPYLKIGEVNDRTKSVSSAQRPESSAKNANALVPRLHTLFQLSTARPWSLDSFFFFSPRLWSLVSRLAEGSAFGLGLCAEGCFF
jgi:hypothetical protein